MAAKLASRLRTGTQLAFVCCLLCLAAHSTSALDTRSFNNIHLASISAPGGATSAEPPSRAAGTEANFDTLPRSYLIELDANGDLEQWRRWAAKLSDKAQGVAGQTSSGAAAQVRKRVARAFASALDGFRSQLRQHGFMAEEQSGEEQVQKSSDSPRAPSRSASAEPIGVVDDGAPPLYFRIRHEFDDASLLLGLSVTVIGYAGDASSDWTQLRDMKLLAAAKSVMRISPIAVIPPPSPWDGVIHIASSGASEASEINARRGPLDMLGVPALHAEGINGSGVKIAIIDTGVDWTHPFLGAGFGAGRKVSFGYDLVGDDYDGFNDPVADNDPLSSCGPHGTHIAGIIGGTAPPNAQGSFANYSGIAPGAELGVFRVFGCRGGTADDILLKALQRAVKANADIITMSVGSPAGWSDTSTARMVSAVAAKGRVVTVSAGNDGDAGLYFQSTPSVASDALAVASVNNDFLVAYTATFTTPSGETKMMTYYSARDFRLTDVQIWPFVTAAAPTVLLDGCSTIPESAPADLSNLVVIVKRGGCSLEIKFRNLSRSRVRYVLVANTGLAPFYPTGFGIERAALIEGEDAELLIDLWNAQKSITLNFPAMIPLSLTNRLSAGIISPFSSYGPTFDLLSAPGIAAPGDRILSTWPVNAGGWAVLSGTSMAAPFTAGAAALLIQAAREGKCKAGMDTVKAKAMDINGVRSVLDRLRSTARPASNSTKSSMLETAAKQGSGLLNAFDAVHALTSVSPASFMLGDSAIYPVRRSFTVGNGDDEARDFVISHDAAGTALTFTAPSAYPNDGPAPLVEPHLSVSATPSTFTLQPGSKINVSVIFTLADKDIDLDTFPVFSGYLRVASTPLNSDSTATTERIAVSYLGIGKATSANQVLDRGVGIKTTGAYSVPVLLIGGDERRPQQLPRAYTFLDNDYPVASFRLLAGSRKLSVDLIEDLQADASGAARRGLQRPGAMCDESQSFQMHSASSSSFPHLFFQAAPAVDYEAEDDPPLMIRAAAPQPTRAAIQATPEVQPLDIMRGREVGPIAVSTLLPRNTNSGAWSSYALAWDGNIAGSPVPTGEYRLRISALKLGVGEPDAGQDLAEGGMRYDRWWSPIIRVQRSLDMPGTQPPKAEVKTPPTQAS